VTYRLSARAAATRVPRLCSNSFSFTEPLSCALHAVERAEIKFEDVVVVAGCGPIGLGMVAGSKSKNPKAVVALDMAQDKLDLAKDCGADVIINIGQEDAVSMAATVPMSIWRGRGIRPQSAKV
jgi:erythritol/L-threitol dehydrogenase